MRHFRKLALGASLLALAISACTTGGGSSPIKIGSDGFYESRLMAEIYAQVLEANGYKVERNLGLGARPVTAAAIESGQIDLKPEYLGSGLGYYDKTKPTGDPATNKKELQTILTGKGGGITVLGYTPGQDTNAFVVRPDTAAQFNLKKISDLTAVASQLTWGLPPECIANPLCGGALKDAYGIDIATLKVTPLGACDAPIAEALNSKAVDVAELCSTQPAIAQFGFVSLEDDKKTQPAENLAPIVRNDFLVKVDKAAFSKLLDDVSAKVTTEVLLQLGVEVAVNNKDVDKVATAWLKEQGFIK
ncbi:MAG: ABC transporter substrate-binding protein [Chloroflexi bacterium]|nr:ABC transporter substrate-binding protein [Chloroflexota bacterium]